MSVQSESEYLALQRTILPWVVGALLIVGGIAGAYYAGKHVADREAALQELRKENVALKAEGERLKNLRPEIQKDTAKNVEATRSNRAQIDTPGESIQDAEANIGIHIRPSPSDVQGSVPDAPSVVLAQSELPLLTSYITDFKTNLLELNGCKKELAVCDSQIANLTKQKENVGEQLKIESKKSGWLGKAKWFVIGAGGGALAGYLAHR